MISTWRSAILSIICALAVPAPQPSPNPSLSDKRAADHAWSELLTNSRKLN